MSQNRSQHVIPNANGGWSVRPYGAIRATRVFANEAEAVQYARGIARREHSELVLHGRDGMVRDRRTYAASPLPPKG